MSHKLCAQPFSLSLSRSLYLQILTQDKRNGFDESKKKGIYK